MDNHIDFDNLTQEESKQLTHILVLLTARKLLQSEDQDLEQDLQRELYSLLGTPSAGQNLNQTKTSRPEQGTYVVTEDMHRALQNSNSVCLLGWLIKECQKAKEEIGVSYITKNQKDIESVLGLSRRKVTVSIQQLEEMGLISTHRCQYAIQYSVNSNWKDIIQAKAKENQSK